MADEPDNMVLRLLREIRTTQEEQSQILLDHTRRFDRLEKRLEDYAKLLRYAMGQNDETSFRQTQQESRMDELFAKLEELLKPKEPV
jgi:ribosomal protein S18 acetylase RimI-like enzyme